MVRCVEVFLHTLRAEGILEGGEVYPKGLPMPDGGEVIDLHVPASKVSRAVKRTWLRSVVYALRLAVFVCGTCVQLSEKQAEAATLPRVLLTDIDINWLVADHYHPWYTVRFTHLPASALHLYLPCRLQTIGEGWAAPLRGFMREGVLVQTLHHNSILVDPFNVTGTKGVTEKKTEWNGEPPVRHGVEGLTAAVLLRVLSTNPSWSPLMLRLQPC